MGCKESDMTEQLSTNILINTYVSTFFTWFLQSLTLLLLRKRVSYYFLKNWYWQINVPMWMQPTYQPTTVSGRTLLSLNQSYSLLSTLTEHERDRWNHKTYVNSVKLYLKYLLNSKTIIMYFLEMNLVLIAQGSRDLLVAWFRMPT